MGDDWKRLGLLIKRRRRALGMSQIQLAEAAGLGRSTIQKLEWATASPEPDTLAKIEKTLRWRQGSMAAILTGGSPTSTDEGRTAGSLAIGEREGDYIRVEPARPVEPDLVVILNNIVMDLMAAVRPDMTLGEVKQYQERALETARELGLKPPMKRQPANTDDDPES